MASTNREKVQATRKPIKPDTSDVANRGGQAEPTGGPPKQSPLPHPEGCRLEKGGRDAYATLGRHDSKSGRAAERHKAAPILRGTTGGQNRPAIVARVA